MTQIESSLYAAIGDHSVGGPNAKVVNLRLPETLADYLAALAHQNERSLAEEIRAALRVSVLLSRLNIVLDDKLQARRRGSSDGILGLSPETATRYATDLREELAAEWGRMLPGSHARHERAFPDFLWTAEPGTTARVTNQTREFMITIEVPAEDFAVLEAVTAALGSVTAVAGRLTELKFTVHAENEQAANAEAWQQMEVLREQGGLCRLAEDEPSGFR